MDIRIIAIGKFKRGPERDLFTHYATRIGHKSAGSGSNWSCTLIECPEPQVADSERRSREAGLIADKRRPVTQRPGKQRPYMPLLALDEGGKQVTSIQLANHLEQWMESGGVDIVIGGADGLDPALVEKADLVMAFGRVTWPHLLVRGLIAEQLYRARMILANHPYHRA